MHKSSKTISLYVYYKFQSSHLDAVLANASVFWQAVRSSGIKLELETLIKRETPASEFQTLMEHYALPPEDADLAIQQIKALAQRHLMPEPRHVEIFTGIGSQDS
jgi:hypothetical protein